MISYRPLMKLLDERNITLAELREAGSFSSATISKIGKGESLTGDTLDRICLLMGAPIEKVMEIVGYDENPFIFKGRKSPEQRTILIKNLKKVRADKGITQGELAELMGVHQPIISKWEKDDAEISLLYFNKLKEVLGVKDEDLR